MKRALVGLWALLLSVQALAGVHPPFHLIGPVGAIGGGGSTGPGTPGSLVMIQQGGVTNYTAPVATSQVIEWQPATQGTYSIAGYKVYRNGTYYASVTSQVTFQGYITAGCPTSPPSDTLGYSDCKGGTLVVTTAPTSGPAAIIVNEIISCITNCSGFVSGTAIPLQFTGTAGSTGTYHVNQSQTVGSSGSPATFGAWIYQDTSATGSNPTDLTAADTVYAYSVSAVDTQSTESSQNTNEQVYLFYGYSTTRNQNFDDTANVTTDYFDTSCSPTVGPYDIKYTWGTSGSYAAPITFAPLSQGGSGYRNAVDIGAATNSGYIHFLIKPLDSQYTSNALKVWLSSPVPNPIGDAISNNFVTLWPTYCTPALNTWTDCKVPMSVIGFGTGAIHGSISGSTLTITSNDSGIKPDSANYVSGTGVPSGSYAKASTPYPATSQTLYTGAGGSQGPISVTVGNESMAIQRTTYYKMGIEWNSNPSGSTSMCVQGIVWSPT